MRFMRITRLALDRVGVVHANPVLFSNGHKFIVPWSLHQHKRG